MSLSGSGQPSSSSNPSLSSGSFGHLSSSSRMPSLSLSGSGQPSSSSKPSLSSGSFGHLSVGVGDAVLVVVGIGAAVLVLEAVLVLGLVGHLSTVSRMPSWSRSPGAGGTSHLPTRQPVGGAGVVVGDCDVLAGAEVVALVELARGELDVRLGQGQLARRALVGAVVARLLGDGAHLAHVRSRAAGRRSRRPSGDDARRQARGRANDAWQAA